MVPPSRAARLSEAAYAQAQRSARAAVVVSLLSWRPVVPVSQVVVVNVAVVVVVLRALCRRVPAAEALSRSPPAPSWP